jgi:hypothetical protein
MRHGCLAFSFLLVGCAAGGGPVNIADLASNPQPADLGTGTTVDNDGDGLDDGDELTWALAYLPYISTAPTDGCKTGGLAVRVSPHPDDAKLVHIIYDFLYNDDCGLGGHIGDDEAFAITADPTRPAPAGIIAIKTISHQGTACERDNLCGQCSGLAACATLINGGVAWPAVWPSKDKHGSYVNRATACTLVATCLDECDDAATPTVPPIVNVGEPGHPLVHDLTDQGFITTANGWTHMALFHFDPWKAGQTFGGAGDVAADLVDPAFDTPACRP